MIATACDVGTCEAVTTWPHPLALFGLAVVLVLAWRSCR